VVDCTGLTVGRGGRVVVFGNVIGSRGGLAVVVVVGEADGLGKLLVPVVGDTHMADDSNRTDRAAPSATPGTETVGLGGRPPCAWTWFTDPRAVLDPAVDGGPRLLVGCVAGGDATAGDIDVRRRDLGTGDTGRFVLHDQLEEDDHNCPALFVRPDGRYLSVYAKHGNDPLTRWRISTNPHDPTAWEPERTLDNGAGATYANVYRLPTDAGGAGRTYCFTRTRKNDPNVLVSADAGSTWEYGGYLLRRDRDGPRPYVRYASDGDAIHFVTTEEHPRKVENSVYHGVVRDGTLSDGTGTVLNDALLEGGDAPAPSDLTAVFENGVEFDGTALRRAWTVDITVEDGQPTALLQARAEDDWHDHRYLYAHHDGDHWRTRYLARAGPGLYDSERDYTGLAALDPADPSRVVASTPVDPRTGGSLDHRELFAGVTADAGRSWDWTALTPDASTDHLRPLLVAGEDRTVLVWMRGAYTTYTDFETEAVLREEW